MMMGMALPAVFLLSLLLAQIAEVISPKEFTWKVGRTKPLKADLLSSSSSLPVAGCFFCFCLFGLFH